MFRGEKAIFFTFFFQFIFELLPKLSNFLNSDNSIGKKTH